MKRYDYLVRIWIFGISFLSALINLVALSKYAYSLSHYTGNFIDLVIDFLRDHRFETIATLAGISLCFVIGSALATGINRQEDFSVNHRYGELQISIGILILLVYFLIPEKWVYLFLLSTILGSQNGLIRTYKGFSFKTTHVTGTLTDLGSYIGYRIRGDKSAGWKIAFDAGLLFAFGAGSAVGYLLYREAGDRSFFWCGIAYLLWGVFYLFLRSRMRSEKDQNPT